MAEPSPAEKRYAPELSIQKHRPDQGAIDEALGRAPDKVKKPDFLPPNPPMPHRPR